MSRAASGFIDIDLGATPRTSGTFTFGAPAPGRIIVQQAAGPYRGKGTLADEAEMDSVIVSTGLDNSRTVRCFWRSSGAVVGFFRFNWMVV
jgi:hypothetical protein